MFEIKNKLKLKYDYKERHSQVRHWSQKEIIMYEQLKKYDTLTELVFMLLKLETRISALSARELLKDHPMKPGARGIAQAISRVYQKLEPIMIKDRQGRQVFYQFKNSNYAEIDLKDLMAVYLRKKTIEEIVSSLYVSEVVPSEEQIKLLIKKYQDLEYSLAVTQKQVSKLIDQSQELRQRFNIFENSPIESIGESLGGKVTLIFNFGKED